MELMQPVRLVSKAAARIYKNKNIKLEVFMMRIHETNLEKNIKEWEAEGFSCQYFDGAVVLYKYGYKTVVCKQERKKMHNTTGGYWVNGYYSIRYYNNCPEKYADVMPWINTKDVWTNSKYGDFFKLLNAAGGRCLARMINSMKNYKPEDMDEDELWKLKIARAYWLDNSDDILIDNSDIWSDVQNKMLEISRWGNMIKESTEAVGNLYEQLFEQIKDDVMELYGNPAEMYGGYDSMDELRISVTRTN